MSEEKESTPVVESAQKVLPSNHDLTTPFEMDVHVHLWEKMTSEVIKNRILQYEGAVAQIVAAMDQLDANGAKGNEDWTKLENNKLEFTRQLEHTKNNIKVDDIVFKAKTKGVSKVEVGSEWNMCLERHVVVEDGFVTRILAKAPV